MNNFKSWKSFRDFKKMVIKEFRYIRDESMSDFLDTLIKTSESRVCIIERGTPLYRAQLGHDWQPYEFSSDFTDNIPAPFSTERMKPLLEEAKEGRANPKGIPYLYLATDEATAIGEVRPWVGSHVSVGVFIVQDTLKVIDFSEEDHKLKIYIGEPTDEQKEVQVWADVGASFSKPITNSDSKAEYAPTQIIAELFKSLGYKGIIFNSSLGNGKNIVLFNINDALQKTGHLFHVKNFSLNSKKSVILTM